VVLPDVDVARHVVLKRAVVEKGCRLPAGLQVGVDPEADRRRFHVTHNGVTLITPEMLGQEIHQVR
jgi:glucose-1-phosphate adenylyltransferase